MASTHCMVDLETLSTRTNARILAIGAVLFDPASGIYDRYYQAILTPKLEVLRNFHDFHGFHVSLDTLDWWEQQDPEAKAVFDDPNAVQISTALWSFTQWLLQYGEDKDIMMWGNGAAFDNAILSSAYALCAMEQPWKFWNDRCYRTVKGLYPQVPLVRLGTHHNALNDAESQAEHLLAMKVI